MATRDSTCSADSTTPALAGNLLRDILEESLTTSGTGPVSWSVQDHGSRLLLVAAYPESATTDDGNEITDEPWVLWGGNDILESAGATMLDSGMDNYRDRYGEQVVTQWSLSDLTRKRSSAWTLRRRPRVRRLASGERRAALPRPARLTLAVDCHHDPLRRVFRFR